MSQTYAIGGGVLPPSSANNGGVAGFDNNKYVLKDLDFDYWPYVCQGRLTLTTGTPVTTADVTAATTIYYAPYKGNRIALYDTSDAVWKHYEFSEISISVPATTVTMYDVWAYDSSGSVTLEVLAWTNDTTRATALTTQDGVYVKTGDASRRYLGSFRTTGVSGQTEDSETKRFVWNYYNRTWKRMEKTDGTNHTYATAVWRYFNNDSSNKVELIVGVAEDLVHLSLYGGLHTTTFIGFGIDTASTGDYYLQNNSTLTNRYSSGRLIRYAEGYHYVAILELAAGGTGTFETATLSGGING